MDLLTTYTHDSELQALHKAIADLHTLKIIRTHFKSSQSSVTSRYLVTDLNNGDS
jgi:hypothetical protein